MQREKLEQLLNQALIGDQTFEDTLRATGLLSRQTRNVRRWNRSQLVVFQGIQEDISRMDTLVLRGRKRRNSDRSIISHPVRAQDYYNKDTEDLRTDSTRGIDALINIAIRTHDMAEEITNIECDTNQKEERDLIRRRWVDTISAKILQRISFRTSGKHNAIELFNDVNIYTVIPAVIDKLTPYKKTRAVMSESYIDVLRLIFKQGPPEATYIAAVAKCYERAHNTRTMYADIKTVRRLTSPRVLDSRIQTLERLLDSRQDYRAKKLEYKSTHESLRRMEKNRNIESLDPVQRIMELYKGFLLANEALNYLINTADGNHSKTDEGLRERLFRGVEFLLETVSEQAERHSKALVVYHTIRRGSRNGNTDLHDILGVDSEVELYKALEKAADEYLDSERAETSYHERGNTRETLFDGTLYDLTWVERKKKIMESDDKTRNETYATQRQLHIQDGVMLGKYAGRMLKDMRSGKDLDSIKRIVGWLNLQLNPE